MAAAIHSVLYKYPRLVVASRREHGAENHLPSQRSQNAIRIRRHAVILRTSTTGTTAVAGMTYTGTHTVHFWERNDHEFACQQPKRCVLHLKSRRLIITNKIQWPIWWWSIRESNYRGANQHCYIFVWFIPIFVHNLLIKWLSESLLSCSYYNTFALSQSRLTGPVGWFEDSLLPKLDKKRCQSS